jgi:hypothetical protein
MGHSGWERRLAAMVMAGDKNRDSDKNQGGDQTADRSFGGRFVSTNSPAATFE